MLKNTTGELEVTPVTTAEITVESTREVSGNTHERPPSFGGSMSIFSYLERQPLDKYMRKLKKAQTVKKVRKLKFQAIEYARLQRKNGTWDAETDGYILQDLIKFAQSKERKLSDETVGVLEAPELSKMLRDDRNQHICDVKMCCSMLLGWVCIFVFCHIPWIISIFLLGVSYSHDPYNPSQYSQKIINRCDELRQYALGFFIIYCTNIVIGFAVAVARTIDNSKNICTKISPFIMSIISVTIVGYNFYGIIVVWNYDLWHQPLPSDCQQLRGLSVATISFFFVLPIVCFGVMQLVGNRERETPAIDDEDHQLDANSISEVQPTTHQDMSSQGV